MIKYRSVVGYGLSNGCSNYWLRHSKRSKTGIVLVMVFDKFSKVSKFSKIVTKNHEQIIVRKKGKNYFVSVPVEIDLKKFKIMEF